MAISLPWDLTAVYSIIDCSQANEECPIPEGFSKEWTIYIIKPLNSP